MKCANCGNELEPKTIYCKNCGQAIQMVPEYNVLEEELLSQVLDERPKEPVASVTPAEKEAETDTKKLSKKSVAIIVSALVIAFVIAITLGTVYLYHENNFDYQYGKGQAYIEVSDYENAVVHFEKAVSIQRSKEAYTYLAICHYFMGEYEVSIEYANSAIEMDELYEDAYRYLIYAYVALGRQDKISEIMNSTDNLLVYKLISGIIIDAPDFKPISGSYSDDVELVLESNGNYDIYYTLDGSDPMVDGTLYTGPLLLTEGTCTVNAVCVSEDNKYGIKGSATYNIWYMSPAYPSVEPSSGTYYGEMLIEIKPPSEDCRLFYTWDGTEPDESSAEYLEPIEMIYGNNILSIIAIDKHGLKSDVLRCNFIHYE